MSKNTKLFVILLALAFGMLGLSYAFVPLYKVFCQAFGIPVPQILVGQAGEPKTFTSDPSARTITVRFMANNAIGVPVTLTPLDRKLKVKLGEPVLTAYRADNKANTPMDGVAVHTIVPLGSRAENVEEFVDLQQCFCFEEQHYPANDSVNLPLSFTITPDLPDTVHTVTFAYTLFEATK